MRLAHTGSYVFNGSMGALAKLEFASHGMDNETRVKNYEKRRRKNKRKEIEYAFNEDQYIQELKNHIDSTYTALCSKQSTIN